MEQLKEFKYLEPMKFETIQTERLLLRKLTDDDYSYIFQHLSDTAIMKLLNIETLDKLEIEKQKQEKGYSTFNKRFLIFQLLDKETQHIIGWCGYHTWYIDHGRAEIGYGLIDEHTKGKGLMSEALKAVLRYGFEQMQLNRVEAFVAPENIPSLKLVDKFNFTREGQLRKHYLKDGNLEDSVVFGLLKEEWEN